MNKLAYAVFGNGLIVLAWNIWRWEIGLPSRICSWIVVLFAFKRLLDLSEKNNPVLPKG